MHLAFAAILAALIQAAIFAALLMPFDSEARGRKSSASSARSAPQKTDASSEQSADPGTRIRIISNSNNSNSASSSSAAAEQEAARERQRQSLEQQKRMAEMRERREKKAADVQSARDERANQKFAFKYNSVVVADALSPLPLPAPKATPTKISSYRDANGVMHFSDGTDASSQANQRAGAAKRTR